jgi:ATP-dependent RNA helicase DDX52/ROK1
VEDSDEDQDVAKSRDRTGKRDTSDKKLQQVHAEQVAAFRRSVSIRLANKHDPDVPDPISSFQEMKVPKWWTQDEPSFQGICRAVQGNIEAGRWKEPTPIQMQAIPHNGEKRLLLVQLDGIRKVRYILPALSSGAPYNACSTVPWRPKESKKEWKKKKVSAKATQNGEIVLSCLPFARTSISLHQRSNDLGLGKPVVSPQCLSKSNAPQVSLEHSGCENGDILISTPLRLVDSDEKGLGLDA